MSGSSDIRITAGPPIGDLQVEAFLETIRSSLTILRELDSAISLKRSGTLRWIIADLRLGSPATVVLRGQSRPETRDFGPEVARAYLRGLTQLEKQGTCPPYFTEEALRAAATLSRIRFRPEGSIMVMVGSEEVTLTERVAANVRELAAQRFTTMGSVEGTLEMVTLHGQNYFRVYDAVHGLGVQCMFSPQDLEKVRAGLGKRVCASGRMAVNRRGDKLAVRIEKLCIFPPEDQLPKPRELRGLARGMTEGRSSEDYVRELWADSDE
jgi:hypothetical protein